MKSLHPIQIKILTALTFAEKLRHSDIKKAILVENNLLQFHLNSLISRGLISKGEDGLYFLTTQGKSISVLIDTDSKQLIKHHKISVRLICLKKENQSLSVVLYTRKKHPFYNYQGFPTGKVRVGETFLEAGVRELQEETTLTGEGSILGFSHFVNRDKTERILEDKLFVDILFINPQGKLRSNQEGIYQWIQLAHVEEFLKQPFDSLENVLYLIDKATKPQSLYFDEYMNTLTHF